MNFSAADGRMAEALKAELLRLNARLLDAIASGARAVANCTTIDLLHSSLNPSTHTPLANPLTTRPHLWRIRALHEVIARLHVRLRR